MNVVKKNPKFYVISDLDKQFMIPMSVEVTF